MEEIKVGMYAYSKESRDRGMGEIVKIDNDRTHLEVTIKTKSGKLTTRKEFVIASYDIKDLIVVGDFVTYRQANMYFNIPTRVISRYNRRQKLADLVVGEISLKNVKITSIVTKEQFEREAYKL